MIPTNDSAGASSVREDTIDELDTAALRTYLSGVIDLGSGGELHSHLIAGGRSNPTYRIWDSQRSWVLRRPPYGHYVESGHDMGREVTAMSALVGTIVPVPTIVTYCQDRSVIGAPFYVMDELAGRTLRTQDDTAELSRTQRSVLSTRVVQTLGDLHSIDPAGVGLQDWGRPDGYLDRQIRRWERSWEAVATQERPEPAEILRKLRSDIPQTRFPGIVHGDFKIDNVMVDNDDPVSIIGVLDWEMSTLGDTLADLGLLVSFWDEPGGLHNPITKGATALPGFPSAADVIEMYATRMGISVDDLDWYVIFSDLKIAVILEQIHRRHLDGTTTGDWFDDIGGMVGPLLDRALERAARSSNRQLRR